MGDERPENVVANGDGADAMLSGSEALLNIRLSVWRGLGVITEGSLVDFLSSDTASIEDRLALLECPCLTTDETTLDLRRARSGTSDAFCPAWLDNAEFRVARAGRLA